MGVSAVRLQRISTLDRFHGVCDTGRKGDVKCDVYWFACFSESALPRSPLRPNLRRPKGAEALCWN